MTEIEIAEQKFELIKHGRAQAVQVHLLGKWLAHHGGPLMDAFDKRSDVDSLAEGMIFLGAIMDALEPDVLLDLFCIVLGCPPEFAEEHFDIMVLVDGMVTVYKEHGTIRSLVDRFFSTNSSSVEPEDSSTTSE